MANGDTLLAWNAPLEAIFPQDNRATLGEYGVVKTLEFPQDVLTSAILQGYVDVRKAGANNTFRTQWLCRTSASGNVIWQVEVARGIIDNSGFDLDGDPFAAAKAASADAAPAAIGQMVQTDIALSNAEADSLAANEFGLFRLSRNGASASDTLDAPVQVVSCAYLDVT